MELRIGETIREIIGFPGTYFGCEGNPDLRANSWKEAFVQIVESVLEDAARMNEVFDYWRVQAVR